jgi:hypothetical protein
MKYTQKVNTFWRKESIGYTSFSMHTRFKKPRIEGLF